jgi:4-aminobutyrate aminotransferase-like enzyme
VTAATEACDERSADSRRENPPHPQRNQSQTDFREKLEELQQKHPLIGDVRGMSLMQALELVDDRATKRPSPAGTNAHMEEARKRGLLIGKGGFYGNVIRMSPPLNISKADVDEVVRILDESFGAVKHPN